MQDLQEFKQEVRDLREQNTHLAKAAAVHGEFDLMRDAQQLRDRASEMEEWICEHRNGGWKAIAFALAALYCVGSGIYVASQIVQVLIQLVV